jgi:hypothetical protein
MNCFRRLPSTKQALEYLEALEYLRDETSSLGRSGWSLVGRISSIWRRIGEVIGAMADYHAAAALYEELSRLSDAELNRRGLTRESLARHILAACEDGRPPAALRG